MVKGTGEPSSPVTFTSGAAAAWSITSLTLPTLPPAISERRKTSGDNPAQQVGEQKRGRQFVAHRGERGMKSEDDDLRLAGTGDDHRARLHLADAPIAEPASKTVA